MRCGSGQHDRPDVGPAFCSKRSEMIRCKSAGRSRLTKRFSGAVLCRSLFGRFGRRWITLITRGFRCFTSGLGRLLEETHFAIGGVDGRQELDIGTSEQLAAM